MCTVEQVHQIVKSKGICRVNVIDKAMNVSSITIQCSIPKAILKFISI